MAAYPQLTSGALSQFPLKKHRATRTVVNTLGDGSEVRLADVNGAATEWQLQYTALSDAEAASLQQFFQLCEGSLSPFTFVDPAGNLLAWSEDLTNEVWQAGPFLAVTGGAADPLDGTNAFILTNSGAASQGISQTLNTPGGYVYCLSVYLKSSQSSEVTLSIGSEKQTVIAGLAWNRFSFTANGDTSAPSVVFSIQCAPGAVSIFGPQVEVQPAPSGYKKSTAGGVYQNARFQGDSLRITSTAPDQNSVAVNITYANHL